MRSETYMSKMRAGIRADGPDVVWVEHDDDATLSYVRGIRGEPRDFLRTRDVLTWSVRSPAWHWSAVDVDYANKRLFIADKADRFTADPDPLYTAKHRCKKRSNKNKNAKNVKK